jgi:hypothetical protein
MESEYLTVLKNEINRKARIYKNSKLFVLDKKLIPFEHTKNISKDELPIEAYFGTIYLIKNNSILEFYSYACDDKNTFRNDELDYKCHATFHNMNYSDVGEFNNADNLVSMGELVSYTMDRAINFMLALIKNGFKLYLNGYV